VPASPVLLGAADPSDFERFQRGWFRTLLEPGYAIAHWPAEWGGGRTLSEQIVLHEELRRANAPELSMYIISLHHTPGTLRAHATPEQQRRYVGEILDGAVWCQGFSEPEAGSDLASLKTRAVRRGSGFVINGQKVWSTMAMFADRCLLLARTDTAAPKRRGISCFAVDMHQPGVEVRPIKQPFGGSEFCELFFDDFFVPADAMVGGENEGWRVAQTTLATERGPFLLEFVEGLRETFGLVIDTARRVEWQGRAAVQHGDVQQRLAQFDAEIEVTHRLVRSVIDRMIASGQSGPEASLIKVQFSELLQRLLRFAMQLEGGQTHVRRGERADLHIPTGEWLVDYMNSFQNTIAGGSNEIQRTLIGERLLGLPRDTGMS
jgi:alkylation response protein AidB-like acyl-CoA dehydrogenase